MKKKVLLLLMVLVSTFLLFSTGCATGGQSGELKIDMDTGEISEK